MSRFFIEREPTYSVKYIGNGKKPGDKGTFYDQLKGDKFKVTKEFTEEGIKYVLIKGFGNIAFMKKFYIKCKE